MTKGRLRGPLSFNRRSIESLPDDDVPFDVVDGEMDVLARHRAGVPGSADRPITNRGTDFSEAIHFIPTNSERYENKNPSGCQLVDVDRDHGVGG